MGQGALRIPGGIKAKPPRSFVLSCEGEQESSEYFLARTILGIVAYAL